MLVTTILGKTPSKPFWMLKGVILFGFKVDGCLAFEFEGVF
jgi:hypothetical protein